MSPLGSNVLGSDVLGGSSSGQTSGAGAPSAAGISKIVEIFLTIGKSSHVKRDGKNHVPPLYIGEALTELRIIVYDMDDAALFLVDPDSLVLTFARGDGTTFQRTPTSSTTCTAAYVLAAADLDQPGRWQLQGTVTSTSGARWPTNCQHFTVYPSL